MVTATASGEFRAQRVKSLIPEGPERLQPSIELLQGSGVDGVQSSRALRAHVREAALAQNPEVLRDGGLADAELLPDDNRNITRRELLIEEQLQYPLPDRIAENVERVHTDKLAELPYIRQD